MNQAEDRVEPRSSGNRPAIGTAIAWSILGGVVSGGLGILGMYIASRTGHGGLGTNIFCVLLSLLVAGLIAGPHQRHQLGGSLAAAIAFTLQLLSSFFLSLPIDLQQAAFFQARFLAGLGYLAAVLLGAAAASLWTSKYPRQGKE